MNRHPGYATAVLAAVALIVLNPGPVGADPADVRHATSLVEQEKDRARLAYEANGKYVADNRQQIIDGLVARGAERKNATDITDKLIAESQKPFSYDQAAHVRTLPEKQALDHKLRVLAGVSNLGHDRFQSFAKAQGLTVDNGFYQCLCSSYSVSGTGIRYSPPPDDHCQTSLPCKGGNWGCVAHNLPNDPAVWGKCVVSNAPTLLDQIGEKVKEAKDRYDKDVCARLNSVLEVTTELERLKSLISPRNSIMVTQDFEATILDTLWSTSGVIETSWGTLADKGARVKQWVTSDFSDRPTGLGYFLTEGDTPWDTGLENRYVAITKVPAVTEVAVDGGTPLKMSYEMALALRIIRSTGNLSPGDVLRMSVEVTKGDVPLANLVAHNLLKEAAYARRMGKPMRLMKRPGPRLRSDVPEERAEKEAYREAFGGLGVMAGPDFTVRTENVEAMIRSKLSDIRPVYDPHVADRLGPWYHTFGLLFVGTNPALGQDAAALGAATENVTRMLNAGSGRSLGKEAANRCAAQLVRRMNAVMGVYPAVTPPSLPPTTIEPIIPPIVRPER